MLDKELLKFYREESNTNFRVLSRKLKCTKKDIESWESGESIPTTEQLEKLAEIYKINVEDLYIKEPKKNNIIVPLILLILGILLGIYSHNIAILILLPTFNLVSYLLLKKIKKYKRTDSDLPKSLFGYDLDIEDLKIYLIEANIISSIYSIISILFRILGFDTLTINIEIVSLNSVNTFLIIVISYLLLMAISFIIELGFGKYMLKRYREV